MNAELPRYWTPEFVEVFAEKLRTSDSFLRAAGSFSKTIILRVLDTPDGKDGTATYVFEKGKLVRHELVLEDAPSSSMRNAPFDSGKAFARTTAPYDLWVKLDRGEMNVAQALMSPDYNLEGPKIRIMRHIGTFNAMSATAASVNKRY